MKSGVLIYAWANTTMYSVSMKEAADRNLVHNAYDGITRTNVGTKIGIMVVAMANRHEYLVMFDGRVGYVFSSDVVLMNDVVE